MDRTVETAVVAASAEECYNIAIDFSRYQEWAGDIKDITVYEADEYNRGTLVAFRAAAYGRSASYTLRYSYPKGDPLTINWFQEKADLTAKLDGTYVFTPLDEHHTEVTYTLEVELLVPIPGFVKRRAETKIIHSALKDLKDRAETKAASSGSGTR